MWLTPTHLGPDEISGVLMGTPEDVHNVREGDVLHAPISNVEDWVYWRPDGTQVGFYSAKCFGAPESPP